ncbi:c-di-GMP-binding flagellar brake protein YcgR [Desulfobaculum xiamenense]|uniref:C-di-GMP-binding flagellar brake protein YcgR n=1 Tax=Desulfobaculum xiamenense TaxID=995050 RepID=A0A846QSA6_9BACT|nr:PilZ domain-containing protein [Desulfobaculum xiamenense]NJB69422.1 c-di-GMP-binding flagellar brake protein YcgR [Desulfobaculum xiamenense]
MTSNDRRQETRLPKNFRVELREFRFPLARQPKHEVCCADISAGGMSVECGRKFQEGDKLQVKIYIPSLNKFHPGFFKVFESDAGQYLQAIAEVVRVQDIMPLTRYKHGIRFLDVDYDDLQALRSFIGKSV